MQTTLTLIRHGESFANREDMVEGLTCRGLTARGIAQVTALQNRFIHLHEPFDVLYASTLHRARMTASILAPTFGLPITWEDDLHELRVGEADGLPYALVTERYPQFNRGIIDVHTPVAPKGESWNEFAARCARVLTLIATAHRGQRVAIVCHGGVIEASFLWALDLSAGARTRVAFPARNTALTTWTERASPHDGRREWQLTRHNDATHLDGTDL
jgi:probable phosphoglycerate mutase